MTERQCPVYTVQPVYGACCRVSAVALACLVVQVRPDRGWDVRLPTSAASGLPVPPKTEGWEEEQEQRPHTSQVDQQPTGPAYMGHQASSEDVAHQDVGGTAAAGGMDALRAQDLAGPAVVRAVVATAVGNVLRRHGEGPQGAPHGSGAASRGSAITAAACTTAVAAAVAAAAHAPRDTAALLDNMITHLNMLKWQKVRRGPVRQPTSRDVRNSLR